MEDNSVASAGVALAGIAFAAAALPWGTGGTGPVENVVLAVLGAAAFGAFSLRRHDLLGRTPGALVAGTASLAVVGYVAVASAGVLAGPHVPTSPWAPGLAFVGGLGGVVAAYGDGRGLPERFGTAVAAIVKSLFVGFAGLFAIALWTNVLYVAVTALVPGDVGSTYQLALGAVALGLGTGTVALLYFQFTDETLAYLDFEMPDLRDLGYVAAGTVGLLALMMAISALFAQLGVTTADHSIEQAAQTGNAEVILLLIPASWLIIGPGEELLYRNIIQKSLYGTFGEWGGVLVASVVFSLAHIPAYAAGASLPALLNTLLVIFALSLVLGATYLKTDNTTVSALIHGNFDVIMFAGIYVQAVGGV